MGTNSPWNWTLTVLKIIKMTVRADCAVSARNPLLQSIKALACWRGKESAFGQVSTLPIPCRLLASRIKQTPLSTNLAYLFTFQQRAVRPHFWLEGYQLDEEISTIPATDGKYSLSTHLPSFFPQHNHLEVRTHRFKPGNVFLPLPFSSLPHRHTPTSGSYYLPTKLLQLLLN